MGRVYDVKPGPGERRWPGACRVVALDGHDRDRGELTQVIRVAFDADADAGPATVTAFVATRDDRPAMSEDGRALVRVTYRTRCRVEPAAPDPIEVAVLDRMTRTLDTLDRVTRNCQVAALKTPSDDGPDTPIVVGG